jgi:MFS family permease
VLNISAGATAPIIANYRRYKTVPMIGVVCAILAVAALSWQAPHMSFVGFEIILTALGLGFGPLAPLTGVALQNTVQPWQFGTAVGGMNFMRSLTSTILVAVFGAITLKGTVVESGELAWRFQIAFGVAAVSLTLALIAMWLMEEKPLSTTHER